jgi:acyl carrier protein
MSVELDDIAKTVGLVLGRRKIAPTDRIFEDLGAESADMLNIVVTVEEKYGIAIDEVTVPSIRTVADLFELVRHATARADS